MSAFRLLEERDRRAWDALAASHPAAGFMQSWAWSCFKELEGYRALRLGLVEGEALRGGALAYLFPGPAEADILAIPDGPLLDWDAPCAADDFRSLIAALRGLPQARKAALVRVEPRLAVVPAALAGLPRAPVDLVPEETIELALGPDEAMLAAMKPKARYNARLALRRGVEVSFSSDPSSVHEFHFVFEQTGRYQDFLVEPKSFFINLACSVPPGMCEFAFARHKGMTLAAALTLRHGGTATYLYGGHLPLFAELMANYALHWEIMRRSARAGLRRYDLYGYVPPGRPGHPYDRFSRFKEKFGGEPVKRIGSRDVVFYDRLAEAALAVIAPSRRTAP
ncbi:MAG: peptidoglycan bridge formation glycyltransferase FemA/FemB family protein [Elusimicrobia bacterium]|nr:peptidoglycan bridge formation glycyltransferase FemA/FemB family protein [Elusimicrobiota bacterium]